jgi:DNA-binding NarL/FixJ family response regulator
MRILVIDDSVDAEYAIVHALRGTDHVVAGARDPRELPDILASAEPFDVALVDMIFGRDCPVSGLGALRILREAAPDVLPVVRWSDEEDNRLLYLLAAFAFFSPLAVVPKREGPDAIAALLGVVARGEPVTGGAERYLGQDYVDQLLRNPTELAIWRAMTRFDKRTDIARAAFVSASTVDHFIADMYPVTEHLQDRYGDPAEAAAVRPEHAHNTPLMRLAQFAKLHMEFFRDQDLEPLLEHRWADRHRSLSAASALVRKARSAGHRPG